MARFIFITGGVVSSLGKGLAAAALGALLQARGYTRPAAQTRPLSQRRSRDDDPLSAWRSLRHGGWRRDRSRPWSLRAFYRPPRDTRRQYHHRPDLSGHHQPRNGAAIISARRFRSFRMSPTRSKTSCWAATRTSISSWRDRRHGWRYRGPAFFRSDPPARQ